MCVCMSVCVYVCVCHILTRTTHTHICSDHMTDNFGFEPKFHKITCPSLSVDGDSTWTQWFK